MKEAIRALIAEIERLKGKKTYDSKDKVKSKEPILSSDNHLTEEEFMEVINAHCKKEKERTCPYCHRKNVVKYGFTKNNKSSAINVKSVVDIIVQLLIPLCITAKKI